MDNKGMTITALAVSCALFALPVGASAKQTKIVLSCWGNQNVFDGMKQRLRVFEQNNPDIKVQFQYNTNKPYLEQLTTWIAGGSGPDVFEVEYHTFERFAQWGVLADLGSYIKGDKQVDMSDFYKVCVDAGNYGGRQYGLPYDVSAVWVTENEDLFSQSGLASPLSLYQQGKWNWNAFKNAALKCTKRTGNRIDRIGLFMNWWEYLQMGWVYGTGGKYFNDEKTKSQFAGPASLEAAKFLVDMAAKDRSVQRPNEPVDITSMLPSGKYGMYVGWTTMPSWLTANKAKHHYDIVPMPAGPKSDTIAAQIHSICVLKSSKNKAAAWKLARWLTGKDGYGYAIRDTYFSSTRHSLDKLYQDESAKNGIQGFKFYPEAMRKTRLYEIAPRFPDIQTAFNNAMYPVWNTVAEPAQTLARVDKQVGEMLTDSAKRAKK